ncbi:MAG: arginase [Rhodocyclaceae bacterium]|nr:MAG: arginase [Rhodocyclaceae bacterium]
MAIRSNSERQPEDAAIRRHVRIIGVACGTGARDHGCEDGPDKLHTLAFFREMEQQDDRLRWDQTIRVPAQQGDAVQAVAGIAGILAACVARTLANRDFPLVIGGDHSCAIGTWSGVHAHLGDARRLGLLWLDAHMDSHTFRTSPSRAIHGMPLACLLGYGDPRLTQVMSDRAKLLPQDVCLIGVRSFESGEAALLRNLGVRVYFMDEVRRRGLHEVFREAGAQVSRHAAGYGISLDLDVLDPAEETGVGSPVPGGLKRGELVAALKSVHANAKLLALEVVEYNPHCDDGFHTAQAVCDLCRSMLG